MKKNDFLLALMLTIASLMTGQTAWAVLTWTGNGSSDNPYQIDTYEKLKEFAVIVNGTSSVSSSNTSACAILTADIECTDNTWTPIGNNVCPFMGTFDGCGHTITGLSNAGVNSTPKSVGLFGNVGSSGNVKEVILVDVALSGKNYIGSIAGFNQGNVQKCYVANSSSGSISATGDFVGGIVGNNSGGTIQNCHYSGSGAISADNYLGGIVGCNESGTVNCCYYAGKGAISCSDNVGGVIGLNINNATATNCYYNTNNTTLTKAIGNADDTGNVKGLTATQFKDISNFSGFSTNVWIQGIVAPLLKGMPYTISFDANGGTGSMANQTVTSGSSTTLSANTFTRSGYLFMGWNTKADGTGVTVATDAQAGLVGPETLYAQWELITSGTCGDTDVNDGKNVTWAVTDTNGDGTYETLTISGNGAMADYYSNPVPWTAFKDVLTTVVIGDGVTSIGGNAFYQFTALTSVSIASSVTKIGTATFYECTNLATINGASGVTYVESPAFDNTAWENNLPDGMNCVGHVAYKFNGDGTSVNLDAATTQIYKGCFRGSKITSIIIPASVESIGGYAFAISALQKVYVLRHESNYPEITLLYGGNAFDYCSNLTAIIVPADAYDDYMDGWSSYESKLKRGYTVTCGTNITATSYAPIVAEGETVTLAAPGYAITSASYNDGSDHEITPVNAVWSFTMPAKNVTVTATWKKLLTNTDITIDAIADQTWNNGAAITPTVTVWDGTTDISSECDFAYSDNQDTGTATVTITAKATSTGYSGSTTTTFNIVPKNVSDCGAIQILEDQDGTHGIIDGNYSGENSTEIRYNIIVDKVIYNRTFPTDGYSTIVLPFEVKTSDLCGVDSVLSFYGIVLDENNKWACAMQVVWEKSREEVTLSAYTPYIVRTESSSIDITGGVTFERTRDAFTEKGDWEIRGAAAYTVWDATHNNADIGRVYGFAATAVAEDKIEIGDFVRAEAGAFIRPFRAFLYYRGSDSNWDKSSQARRRAMALDELPDRIPVRIVNADEADGIGTIQNSKFKIQNEGNWYTLDGRKLGGKPKASGIYIHNGKKILK